MGFLKRRGKAELRINCDTTNLIKISPIKNKLGLPNIEYFYVSIKVHSRQIDN